MIKTLFLSFIISSAFYSSLSFINNSIKLKQYKSSKNINLYNNNKYRFYNKQENMLKKLNSKNTTEQTNTILRGYENENDDEEDNHLYSDGEDAEDHIKNSKRKSKKIKLIITDEPLKLDDIETILKNPEIIYNLTKNDVDSDYSERYINDDLNNEDYENNHYQGDRYNKEKYRMSSRDNYYNSFYNKNKDLSLKSNNFEVINDFSFGFKDIGGYEEVKNELKQSIDILKNYKKYLKYNVRTPKGIILEGPPGNGKTLIAKGISGEAKLPLICVSGSEFQDKYVGVGSSKMRELFSLAEKNIPCIIFIDEIDAVGRKRTEDGETASSERDSTLNQLLICLDGFKTKQGIFLIGATNRIDLLDKALLRPGRIDKRVFIGLPDSDTRRAIIDIHIKGKPYDDTVNIDELVDYTSGLSGAEIENLLNEAMLNALRYDKEIMSIDDINVVYNKIVGGYQISKHEVTNELIKQICVHEIGHVMVGLLCQHHSKVKKVIINMNSPKNLGYTLFENSKVNIQSYQSLLEHIMILLGGRIAEELIYGKNFVSTGAINDFEESMRLATDMVVKYGFGGNVLYTFHSDKNKELIDREISKIISLAYKKATNILSSTVDIILKLSKELEIKKILNYDEIINIIRDYNMDNDDTTNDNANNINDDTNDDSIDDCGDIGICE